jgi:hypothetical protein
MSEYVSALVQVGLAQPGEPELAQDRLGVTATLLASVRHSPRFDAGPSASQWLLIAEQDQLLPLLGQVRDAWRGSGTSVSVRMLGDSMPIDVMLQPAQAPAAAQPSPGVLGSEPLPPSDLPAPPAGARNDSGFAH